MHDVTVIQPALYQKVIAVTEGLHQFRKASHSRDRHLPGPVINIPAYRSLAEGYRFSDCSHEHEPGCAVREAVANNTLSEERLGNYLQLSREFAFEREKAAIGLVRIERKRWKPQRVRQTCPGPAEPERAVMAGGRSGLSEGSCRPQ